MYPLHLPFLPLTYPPPISAISDITLVLRKVAEIQQCKLASRSSYKMPAKNCSCYTVCLAWLQSSTRELKWFEYLKSVFLKIPNVTTWSVFQNQVTYLATYSAYSQIYRATCVVQFMTTVHVSSSMLIYSM